MNNVTQRPHVLKFFGLFRMAVKNFRSRAWMNAKMCIAFATLAFLVCLFTVYNSSLTDRRAEMHEESVSANYIWSTHDAEEYLQQEYGITDYTVYTYKVAGLRNRMYTVHGDNAPTCTTNYIILNYDGTDYRKLEGKTSRIVYLYTVDLQTDPSGQAFFTPAFQEEWKYRFDIDSPFLGHLPNSGNEVAISARMLAAFDIDPTDAIGKHISGRIDNDTLNLFDATICGIILDEYYDLSGVKIDTLCPDIITHVDNPFFNTYYGKYLETKYMYFLNAWPDIDADDLFSMSVNDDMRYTGYSMYANLKALDQVMTLANTLYIVIGIALIVGLVLTVYLMIDKYIKVYSRTSGVCASLGMTRRSIYTMLIMQIFLLVVLAVPIAVVMTAVGYIVITKLVRMATGIQMGSSIGQISAMLSIGIGAVLLIASIFTFYVIHKLKRRNIRAMLNVNID